MMPNARFTQYRCGPTPQTRNYKLNLEPIEPIMEPCSPRSTGGCSPRPARNGLERVSEKSRPSTELVTTSALHDVDGVAVFPVDLSCSDFKGNLNLARVIDIPREEEIKRLKQEFIVTLSHELRSPLTSLKLLLELIVAGAYGELKEQGLAKVALAERNIDRLVKLIQDLLDVELVEMGRLTIKKEPVEFRNIIDSAVESCQGPAANADVELKVDAGSVLIDADEDRLTQVLINLVSNAVKFSPKGSCIEVSTRVEDGAIVASVADCGPGVPKEMQTQIFEPFRQGGAEAQRNKGSVGLGLAISKAIVELHGGTIAIDSEIGRGSTVWFKLPLETENRMSKAS